MDRERFLDLRKKLLEKEFSNMNDRQKEAIFTVNGPLLVLAGAGSGKTTVLVNRIANIIKYGDAYFSNYIPNNLDDNILTDIESAIKDGKGSEELASKIAVFPAKPWQILSITFTNKAAGEMKSRLEIMLGDKAYDIKAGTFHSICAKMLRRNADRIGFTSDFTIYDTTDTKRLVKDVMADLNISEKQFNPKIFMSAISKAKNNMWTPEVVAENAGNDYYLKKVSQVYTEYQKKIKSSNAMDFDDLLLNVIELFNRNSDILEYYQNLFRYILIDEYQDTNTVQYEFVRILSEKSSNLCVVGDDDQSIYRFRGATIENILSFEKTFKDAKIIKLEQNYRSTQIILDAANKVIENNKERKGKNLWTSKNGGDKITYYAASDERDEAKFVAESIQKNVSNGAKYSENAVLYRMNAQSNAIENYFLRASIPYRIIGGNKFYDRAEIKDIIAYLKLIINPKDTVALKRIINVPKRGIGDSTVEKVELIAEKLNVPLLEVIKDGTKYAELSRAGLKLVEFYNLFEELTEIEATESPSALFNEVIEKTGYKLYLDSMGDDGVGRWENLSELLSNITKYEEENEEPTIRGFLEEVSLLSDIDNYDADADAVVMMTVHSAKGLEFKNVYIVGMEEGIFPGNQSIMGGESEMEEERRTAYVALTRAKEKLYISRAKQRFIMGRTQFSNQSRFYTEIPSDLITDISVKSQIKTNINSYKSDFKSNSNYTPKATVAQMPKTSPDREKFKAGDRLKHPIFGEGMVVSATNMSNDTLLEIIFDKVGTKKVMQNYAKLTKI
jgi:DNA helicase-2/ATP-dependent DNA helicase PcrA